jgi:hypothetical protein
MDTIYYHSISHLNHQIQSTVNSVLRSVLSGEETELSFHLDEFSLTYENDSLSQEKQNTSASATTSDNDSTEGNLSNTSTFEQSPKGDSGTRYGQQGEVQTNFWNCFSSHIVSTNPKCSKIELMLRKANAITQDILMYLTKNDISKHIMKQQTSRLLQYYLKFTSPHMIHCLFMEIVDYFLMLLKDTYSNYFCLKLFSYLNSSDRMIVINILSNNFIELATNKISTYPFQCIVENLSSIDEQTILIKSLIPTQKKISKNNDSIVTLALDTYGTHVLVKLLTYLPIHLMNPIIIHLLNNFSFLATDANGECSIKKLVSIITTPNDKYFNIIKQKICENAILLCEDPYGNYVLQNVLNVWDNNSKEELMNELSSCFLRLSLQKFSSNVIEKCIMENNNFLLFAVNTLFKHINLMNIMIQNIFGTFVIESIASSLLKSNEPYCKSIMNKFCNYLSKVIQSAFTDEILLTKWNKKLQFYTKSQIQHK